MNGATMLSEFRLGFDIIASGAAPGFEDTQVYSILNRAQDYIIDELYDKKDLINLGALVKNYAVVSGGLAYNFGEDTPYALLPTDYWLYVNSFSIYYRTEGFSSTGIVKSITGSALSPMTEENIHISFPEFEKIQKNTLYDENFYLKKLICTTGIPYGVPSQALLLKKDYNTVLLDINLIYIKKRATISTSTSCELQEQMHRKVVDKAIDTAKVIINIQEPQSK